MFIISVLNRKYHFWANLVQKIKIVSLSWQLVLTQFEYKEFNGDVFVLFNLFFVSTCNICFDDKKNLK